MAFRKEIFVNKYVIQIEKPGHGWELYRLIAKPEDLKQLIAELSIAIEKLESNDMRPQDHDTKPTPLWKGYATRAFERTDRIQFEVLASEDLAPFHRPSTKSKIQDYSQVPLAIFLAVSIIIGLVTMGKYALKALAWLQFALHRV